MKFAVVINLLLLTTVQVFALLKKSDKKPLLDDDELDIPIESPKLTKTPKPKKTPKPPKAPKTTLSVEQKKRKRERMLLLGGWNQ